MAEPGSALTDRLTAVAKDLESAADVNPHLGNLADEVRDVIADLYVLSHRLRKLTNDLG